MYTIFDMGERMSAQERSAWIYGVIAVIGYGAYLALLFGTASADLTETDYVPLLLGTIGGAIVAAIVLNVAVGIASPRTERLVDERDRRIARLGDTVGNSFVAIGAVAALVLAFVEADHFWIANALYLGFVLSALLGALARIGSYREGLHEW